MANKNYPVENPVYHVRGKLKPTREEIAKRSARDKIRPGLLQHEMARRMRCSTSTIRDLERDEKTPSNQAILDNFDALWKEVSNQKPQS